MPSPLDTPADPTHGTEQPAPPTPQQPTETPEANRPSSRADTRLARRREEIQQRERNEPLQRRILAALAHAPATPGGLATTLPAAPESVSRLLAKLRTDDLVEVRPVPGDRRRREYFLSPNGEIELSRHRAFGAPEPPPSEPTTVQVHEFLRSALRNAIAMRRKTNRLEDTVARLRIILEQADRANAHDLALEAMAELATTLRQNRQPDDTLQIISRLERISFGQDASSPAAVALPAAAHREYALGRLTQDAGAGIEQRAEHLTTAAQLYAQLADGPSCDSTATWRERQAWSLISLANNLRARSRYDEALAYANRALVIFEEIDDPYGRSRCLFMNGYCLRLVGDFDRAWEFLHDAHALAVEHAFERFQADALTQMGEVRRCQSKVEEAREYLDEAIGRAKYMSLAVIHAFAQSARGALDYQQHEPARAAATLAAAHTTFTQTGHCEGLALNARRQAIVARSNANSGTIASANITGYLDFALQRYIQLASPAGITACEVERGRLQLTRGANARQIIRSLISRLDDPQQRDLLELDPWVPRVLHVFAEDVDEDRGELVDRTSRLLASAQRRIADRARQQTRQAMQAMGAAWQELERRNNEMGGEARCHQAPTRAPEHTGS